MTCQNRCRTARHKVCKCSCKGENHGIEYKVVYIETMLTRHLENKANLGNFTQISLTKNFKTIIPIQEALTRIKKHKELTKANIEKRDKEEYEITQNKEKENENFRTNILKNEIPVNKHTLAQRRPEVRAKKSASMKAYHERMNHKRG